MVAGCAAALLAAAAPARPAQPAPVPPAAAVVAASAPVSAPPAPTTQAAAVGARGDSAGTVTIAASGSNEISGDNEIKVLDEVVVGARRREENAQNVPVPIAALSGAALEQSGQYRLEDLNAQFPSTNVAFANARQSSIAVRGLGNNPANDALESSVGVYLDDVYLGRAAMANTDLIDVDQVTLLRGPQGTLFGKNTTAGVLNITTRAPSFTPGGDAEASVGNYGYYQLRADATGPLLDDTLAGRISVSRTKRDGYVDNIYDGRELDDTSRYSGRGQLLWKPDEDFSLRVIGEHEEEHADNGAGILYSAGPNGGAKFYDAVAAAGAAVVYDPDYLKTDIDAIQHTSVEQSGTSAEANWQLGGYKLTSITAWRSWHFVPTNDGDSTDVDAITDGGQAVKDQQFSEELRLASPADNPLSYVAGLYYFWQQQNNILFFDYGPDARAIAALGDGSPAFANGTYDTPQYLRTESGAAFGQLTWRALDKWEFAAGLRDTQEGKVMHVERYNNDVSPAFASTFSTYSSGDLTLNNNNTSALLSASYKITPSAMAYASLSRGSKAGGINPAVPNGALGTRSLYVEPETANDGEAGIKTSWLENRVTANANLFWAQVKDYQSTLLEPVGNTNTFVQVLTNVGKVRTRGAEVEVAAQPVEDVTLRLSTSYDNATYLSYRNAPCPAEALAPTNAAQGSILCNLSGKALVGAPAWIVNPGVSWSQHFSDLTGTAELDYAWRSWQYGSTDDSQYGVIPSYGLLDLRYRVSGDLGGGRSWTVTVWSNNLANKHYVTDSVIATGSLYNYTLYPGLPRTYGLTGHVAF
ncbi:MAG TPA: TonB-dependent receptor [Steroidobacteraceae bacterium]|nr:TonB-dependent receptor [Steroidobacteraceae bacterium]